jgi:hypothetical protein
MATITPTGSVNATAMAANWGPGVRNNSQKWLQKYLAPKRLFNADPAGAQVAWNAGVQSALAANSYQNGMANADVTQAANNATQYGVTNYANSGTAKAYKFTAVAPALANAINTSLQSIAGLPRGSGANNENRMITFSRTMHGFKGKIK